MERELINKFRTVLGIERNIVGIKFLFLEEEYEDCEAMEVVEKCTFCSLTGRAMLGQMTKGKAESFSCQGGSEMLGMKPVPNYVKSGKQFSKYHLYEDLAVSRDVQNNLSFVDQKIYGVQVGPLEEMEDADVVMFIANCWQMMRVIQGYTYHNGMAKNIGMIGNQGICADLVARPFQKNDINISLLCLGARLNSRATDGELGAGMPIRIFRDMANGVITTFNAATEKNRKEEAAKRLEERNCNLGFEIEYDKVYGSYERDGKYSPDLYKRELF